MTHTTEQERAEFPSPALLKKLQTSTEGGAILCNDYAGGYDLLTEIWRVIVADEAARRAPATRGSAQLDDTNVVDMAQAVDSKEAAPAQLPEPVAYLHECGKKPLLRTLEFSKVAIQLSAKGYKSLPLYTGQQVRQILAAHGIKEQST